MKVKYENQFFSATLWSLCFLCFIIAIGGDNIAAGDDLKLVVPNIVHQIYDYNRPNFFLYLSLKCVQHYLKPDHHYLWVNDAGRFRKGDWENWQNNAKPGTWEADLVDLFKKKAIEPMLKPFSISPPGNSSLYATNKAHISDFVRLDALKEYGGIYLDTDAFPIRSMNSLRIHDFTMSFDNVVNPDVKAPHRLCNGVFLSTPTSPFLAKWTAAYASFDPTSWDLSSSIIPFQIAVENPDWIHVEWNRLSPISFGMQTANAAAALTCGIYDPAGKTVHYPAWDHDGKKYTFVGVKPSQTFFERMNNKMVLHLTMTLARGYCMMRKTLHSPESLNQLPSLLGSYFRTAVHGKDSFDYSAAVGASDEGKLALWNECRNNMGMHTPPASPPLDESVPGNRQQYVDHL